MRLPRLLRALVAPALVPAPTVDPATVATLGEQVAGAARRRLGRSLGVLVLDAGSCGGCLLEARALDAPPYDLSRFGLRLVDTPRQADVLLVTGPLTRNMRTAVERAWACAPEPRWVVAAGDCAVDGGAFKDSPAVEGGVGTALPVDLVIPGCPPAPAQLLEGLLTLLAVEAG